MHKLRQIRRCALISCMQSFSFLLIFIGGGLGAIARYAAQIGAVHYLGPRFPWGTLGVNVLGGLLMGLITGYYVTQGNVSSATRLFLTVGVLGGFTTFSAFSLDAVALLQRSAYAAAAGYIFASVMLSIAAVAFGLALMRSLS